MRKPTKKSITVKNKKLEQFLNKYFNLKTLLAIIILIVLMASFTDFFKILILMAIFIPMAAYSMMATRLIPHIAVETLSGSVLLLGYLYGPIVALVFGFVGGFYGLYKSGHIRYLMIVRIIVTAIVGALMSFFTGITFNLNFIIGIVAMNVVLFFVYLVIDPDPIQNYTHRASHLLSNVLILRYLFLGLYALVTLI